MVITRGFSGRGRSDVNLPPGQYLTEDFPVLSAGPTPRVNLDTWQFGITTEAGQRHTWSWPELTALPSESITVDLHCVTKWSKFGTGWRGVSVDTLLAGVQTAAEFALARS
jgi:DMSO/TMAO reductase YedYZ molybdopterin-dependent catalytic subunit